jgi:hypothetical protein
MEATEDMEDMVVMEVMEVMEAIVVMVGCMVGWGDMEQWEIKTKKVFYSIQWSR